MRIGFVNIYSWRPHVEHLYYLAHLAREAGHETAFLTCDSSVHICYSRLLRNRSRVTECPSCMAGGVRSYPVRNVTSLTGLSDSRQRPTSADLALSSAATLTRIESPAELADPEVVGISDALGDAVTRAYDGARRWFDKERLDALVCFNGRIDMTAAVVRAAADAGLPFVTHERSWFGDGLSLNPNANCLSIRAIGALSTQFADRPLRKEQAAHAARLVAARFLQKNSLEWKVYNKDARHTNWPVDAPGPRVLVLPSSKNEFMGLSEWQAEWSDNTDALDEFFAAMAIHPGQAVVRCHPNWAEHIGVVTGEKSLNHYKKWCADRRIHCISSEEKHSTYDLIQQADIVVLNGGSAAVEAGVCGKRIFSLGPAFYQQGGFAEIVSSRADLARVSMAAPRDPDEVIRRTLRFVYVAARRFPQFNHQVRARETVRYDYFDGAGFERVEHMLRTGEVLADDATFAEDQSGEDEIVAEVRARRWENLVGHVEDRPVVSPLDIGRRRGLRWIDDLRRRMVIGHDA